MAKTNTIFVCSKCDSQFPKWQGRCTECGAWGTLTEQTVTKHKREPAVSTAAGQVETLAEVSVRQEERMKSAVFEFDRVLGGGIVPGSVTLLGGDPGIGKSTLILQVAGKLAAAGRQVLYISGEESSAQVKIRFSRLGLTTPHLKFLGETDMDTIQATIEQHNIRPRALDRVL
jgi:DNA repair protein RadA/Sms